MYGSYRRRRIVVALTLAGAFSAAAFAQSKPERGSQDAVKREVRHELVMLPFYGVFDNLGYSVNGSEITLTGEVVNPAVKDGAEKAVKGVEGVTKVTNNIQVLPPSPMDDAIRAAEFRAIYGDAALQRYAAGTLLPMHIIVNGGRVTLEGMVSSQSDKDIVSVRAKGVPGVFSVTNNLGVDSSGSRSEK